MPQLVKCPNCQKQLNVPDNLLGKNVKCPACQNAFVATAEPPAEPPPAPRRAPVPEEPASVPAGDTGGLQPHRATLILILGIVGLVLPCCPGVNLVCSILAVLWGNTDLKAMDRGEMDPTGRTLTKIGWILGIVALVLDALAICAGCITAIVQGVSGRGS